VTVGQPKQSNGSSTNNGSQTDTSQIANFIWGIADDVLRDVYVRGKYRDVILPMIVLRRLDIVLESSKEEVLKQKNWLDKEKIIDQEQPLRAAAGQPFYNTSLFTLRDLAGRTKNQQLKLDFEHYLDGFSRNVQDIINNFKFRNQIEVLSGANALGSLISKFIDPKLDLSSLDNHAMGSVYEELVRRFNEENNEEAGEHWTPRDVVRLMAKLVFTPVADKISSGTYLLYDAAIGTGGMLTVAEKNFQELAQKANKSVTTHLYGQEINGETYAICKSDLLLSGEGYEADNIVGGPAYSTLSNDAFSNMKFDFMLSNPPYGKSWKTDLEKMSGGSKKKSDIKDPRFLVSHGGEPEFSLLTRSSDGQMMFLANMVAKMKEDSPFGSRIAQIHNGSSLFTGDAGQGESNVRRWIIERDLVEAVIQLPDKMFYNTPIATYIWVLSNRKPKERKGKIQLVDASKLFTPLRKNLGQKSAELSDQDIDFIMDTFMDFENTKESKIFENKDFGYTRISINRPLRLRSKLSDELVDSIRYSSGDVSMRKVLHMEFGDIIFTNFSSIAKKVEEFLESDEDSDDETTSRILPISTRKRLMDPKKWSRDEALYQSALTIQGELGINEYNNFNSFFTDIEKACDKLKLKLSAADIKVIARSVSWRDEGAAAVIKKIHDKSKAEHLDSYGYFQVEGTWIEYEADPDLADFEQVPLNDPEGVLGYFKREVLPYSPDAWIVSGSETIGYEISFVKQFYKPEPLRSLQEIEGDIKRLIQVSDGLLSAAIGDI
jgi:type I restriction enzyme M protein